MIDLEETQENYKIKQPTIEDFKQIVRRTGGSLFVVIPKNIVDFAGLKEGDTIKVWFRKEE